MLVSIFPLFLPSVGIQNCAALLVWLSGRPYCKPGQGPGNEATALPLILNTTGEFNQRSGNSLPMIIILTDRK